MRPPGPVYSYIFLTPPTSGTALSEDLINS
jgi:hypothetical protein